MRVPAWLPGSRWAGEAERIVDLPDGGHIVVRGKKTIEFPIFGGAWADILEGIGETRWRLGDVEAGGFLLAPSGHAYDLEAHRASTGSDRNRWGSVRLDREAAGELAVRTGLRLVGTWHSHPRDDPETWRPSPADLRGSAREATQFGFDVTLIVVGGEPNFEGGPPDFSFPRVGGAWLTFEEDGRMVAEPLRVRECWT